MRARRLLAAALLLVAAPCASPLRRVGSLAEPEVRITLLQINDIYINGGGIRGDRVVPPEPLSRRDVAALLPFGNVFMVVEATGRALRGALEQGLAPRAGRRRLPAGLGAAAALRPDPAGRPAPPGGGGLRRRHHGAPRDPRSGGRLPRPGPVSHPASGVGS